MLYDMSLAPLRHKWHNQRARLLCILQERRSGPGSHQLRSDLSQSCARYAVSVDRSTCHPPGYLFLFDSTCQLSTFEEEIPPTTTRISQRYCLIVVSDLCDNSTSFSNPWLLSFLISDQRYNMRWSHQKKKRGSNSTAVQMTYKTGNLCHAIISFPFIHSFEISVPLSHIIHSDIRGRQSNMRPAFDSSCHVELLGLLDIPRWEKKHLYLMYTHLPYQVGKCRLVHSIIN